MSGYLSSEGTLFLHFGRQAAQNLGLLDPWYFLFVIYPLFGYETPCSMKHGRKSKTVVCISDHRKSINFFFKSRGNSNTCKQKWTEIHILGWNSGIPRGFGSSGTWCHFIGWMVPNTGKEHHAFLVEKYMKYSLFLDCFTLLSILGKISWT